MKVVSSVLLCLLAASVSFANEDDMWATNPDWSQDDPSEQAIDAMRDPECYQCEAPLEHLTPVTEKELRKTLMTVNKRVRPTVALYWMNVDTYSRYARFKLNEWMSTRSDHYTIHTLACHDWTRICHDQNITTWPTVRRYYEDGTHMDLAIPFTSRGFSMFMGEDVKMPKSLLCPENLNQIEANGEKAAIFLVSNSFPTFKYSKELGPVLYIVDVHHEDEEIRKFYKMMFSSWNLPEDTDNMMIYHHFKTHTQCRIKVEMNPKKKDLKEAAMKCMQNEALRVKLPAKSHMKNIHERLQFDHLQLVSGRVTKKLPTVMKNTDKMQVNNMDEQQEEWISREEL